MNAYLTLLNTLGLLGSSEAPSSEHAKVGLSYRANLKDGEVTCLAAVDSRCTNIQPLDDDCITINFRVVTVVPSSPSQSHYLSGRLTYNGGTLITADWTLTYNREEVSAHEVNIYVVGHDQK